MFDHYRANPPLLFFVPAGPVPVGGTFGRHLALPQLPNMRSPGTGPAGTKDQERGARGCSGQTLAPPAQGRVGASSFQKPLVVAKHSLPRHRAG
jgi:hypothetical protein